MKKVGVVVLLICSVLSVTAQSTSHYTLVKSEVEPLVALEVLNSLEANWPIYEQWLGNRSFTASTLNISFYKNSGSFNDALAPQKLPGRRTDFIYLYYNNPEKNILYIYPTDLMISGRSLGSDHLLSKKAMNEAINRHGFLQYLFAVAPTSPSWFREGSALYFEAIDSASGGPDRAVRKNRDYLANLKEWQNKEPINLEQLLTLTDEDFIDNGERNLVFSWGFINFLVETDRSSLLNAIATAINPSASQESNSVAVKNLVVSQRLESAFNDYIIQTKTFTELMTLGTNAYAASDSSQAKALFMESTAARGDLYSPYYYLGLIAYDSGNYDDARTYYEQALENGAPAALINYNLGFIAFKEHDYDLAVDLLGRAKSDDYAKYGAGADKLLKNIPTEMAIGELSSSKSSANSRAMKPVN